MPLNHVQEYLDDCTLYLKGKPLGIHDTKFRVYKQLDAEGQQIIDADEPQGLIDTLKVDLYTVYAKQLVHHLNSLEDEELDGIFSGNGITKGIYDVVTFFSRDSWIDVKVKERKMPNLHSKCLTLQGKFGEDNEFASGSPSSFDGGRKKIHVQRGGMATTLKLNTIQTISVTPTVHKAILSRRIAQVQAKLVAANVQNAAAAATKLQTLEERKAKLEAFLDPNKPNGPIEYDASEMIFDDGEFLETSILEAQIDIYNLIHDCYAELEQFNEGLVRDGFFDHAIIVGFPMVYKLDDKSKQPSKRGHEPSGGKRKAPHRHKAVQSGGGLGDAIRCIFPCFSASHHKYDESEEGKKRATERNKVFQVPPSPTGLVDGLTVDGKNIKMRNVYPDFTPAENTYAAFCEHMDAMDAMQVRIRQRANQVARLLEKHPELYEEINNFCKKRREELFVNNIKKGEQVNIINNPTFEPNIDNPTFEPNLPGQVPVVATVPPPNQPIQVEAVDNESVLLVEAYIIYLLGAARTVAAELNEQVTSTGEYTHESIKFTVIVNGKNIEIEVALVQVGENETEYGVILKVPKLDENGNTVMKNGKDIEHEQHVFLTSDPYYTSMFDIGDLHIQEMQNIGVTLVENTYIANPSPIKINFDEFVEKYNELSEEEKALAKDDLLKNRYIKSKVILSTIRRNITPQQIEWVADDNGNAMLRKTIHYMYGIIATQAADRIKRTHTPTLVPASAPAPEPAPASAHERFNQPFFLPDVISTMCMYPADPKVETIIV